MLGRTWKVLEYSQKLWKVNCFDQLVLITKGIWSYSVKLAASGNLAGRQTYRKDGKSSKLESRSCKESLKHALDQLDQCSQALDVLGYAALLRQCSNLKALSGGKLVHAHIVRGGRKSDTYLSNLLIQMYGRCGSLEDARAVFDKIAKKNVYSWNLIIAAYADNGHLQEAKVLFERMLQRDLISWTSMMTAYADSGDVKDASLMFARMPEQDVVSWTTMVAAYAKNGHLQEAKSMFDEMPYRNLVSWTAIIAAYAQHGLGKEALKLFRQMDLEGMKANDVTFISILDACAFPVNLREGKAIHARIAETGYDSELKIGNALITMYGKCGSCLDAKRSFDRLIGRDAVSWNGLIAAYAQNDLGKVTPELFRLMGVEGERPDEITFISVLSACSHAGLLEDGWQCFVSLYDYGVVPAMDHYVCLVDLLARVGQLSRAEELIENMPYEPDAVAWRALVSACKVHEEVDRGARAAKRALKLDRKSSGSYLLLSNMYAGKDAKPVSDGNLDKNEELQVNQL